MCVYIGDLVQLPYIPLTILFSEVRELYAKHDVLHLQPITEVHTYYILNSSAPFWDIWQCEYDYTFRTHNVIYNIKGKCITKPLVQIDSKTQPHPSVGDNG